MSSVTLAVSSATTSCRCRTESLVSSVSQSTRDSTLSIRDSASSCELSTQGSFLGLGRLAHQIVPPPLAESTQLHARLVPCCAPHERLQQFASEFALTTHLRLLRAKVRLAPSCSIHHVDDESCEQFFARGRRIMREKSSVGSRFFFSLFFFLSPSVDTTGNRLPMVEIDHCQSISGGNRPKTTPIGGTAQ
ncbi:hypothetical protein BHM03_00014615 [Ensete ventricosum]|uniref:Uncharacterized protein n=1 Tax=Ensete ventricosum TaxID=4639 RepID=A0A445MEC9_ENSVE|nr:hypothetical protein BHM03_00014615 [Ensete ventricosum]